MGSGAAHATICSWDLPDIVGKIQRQEFIDAVDRISATVCEIRNGVAEITDTARNSPSPYPAQQETTGCRDPDGKTTT